MSVRDDVNPYEVLRAWIDPDIDLMSSKDVRGTISPERFRQLNIEAMADSKQAAEVVALERSLGIKAATGKGALVTQVVPGLPGGEGPRVNDVIVAVDGKPVKLADDAIARDPHPPSRRSVRAASRPWQAAAASTWRRR